MTFEYGVVKMMTATWFKICTRSCMIKVGEKKPRFLQNHEQ